MRVEAVGILVRLILVVSVTVDDVHREGIVGDRRHNLDIELVPLGWGEIRTVPVCEEGRDGSFFVWSLHTGHELAVGEFLVGGDGSTSEVKLSLGGGADHSDDDARKFQLLGHLKC